VRDNAKSYLKRKLKLKVNMEKTEARRAYGSTFFGFTFISYGQRGKQGRTSFQVKKRKKLEKRIRLITKRNRGVSIEVVIKELNRVLVEWIGDFARRYLERLMGWRRRRIRQYLWKQWRNGKNRKHRLRQRGVDKWKLEKWELGSNSYWKMAEVMKAFIDIEILHQHYKLADIPGYYNKLRAERIGQDGIVLDFRYNSLFC